MGRPVEYGPEVSAAVRVVQRLLAASERSGCTRSYG